MKLEFENTKYDKENLTSLYESLMQSDKLNKEKINLLKSEKNDLLVKIKDNKNCIAALQQKADILEVQSQNANDFICKFCKNRQSLEQPEHALVNESNT